MKSVSLIGLVYCFLVYAQAFQAPTNPFRKVSASLRSLQEATTTKSNEAVSIRRYEHDGWNLTYRFKPASSGFEKSSPILLVHPVGIGLTSWFWERLLENWTGPAVFAPNLIGCGVTEGGDPWNPDERGLSFPLGWVQGCESLMQQAFDKSPLPFFQKPKWMVVSQGGLAPVAVMLASRNPETVDKLVLASPPTWKEMTSEIPEKELARNYNFLRSPILGNLAFGLLESRKAIEFFSNQFLFSDRCDATWLDNAEKEMGADSRPPIMAFNAGFCEHRSFEEELRSIQQPTLILAGKDDKRPRQEFVENMKDCEMRILPGLNVLPWETPKEFAMNLATK